jgi:EAL domain-containing protein (putative c-di-GMP-specific phosphodiesterase class I)
MYRAKAHGRNRVELGAVRPERRGYPRLELGVDLWHALRRGEFRLMFQPIVDLRDGRLRAMEALVRWQHPTLGLLRPAAFLAVAQEAGLAENLDRWVLAQACGQACRWSRSGGRIPVTVNVSTQRLRDAPGTLARDVRLALERTTLPPQLLTLELNERTVIGDPDLIVTELQGLRRLGVGLALDDFGAGHTSLTHLRKLPIDTLKIDITLVHGALDTTDDHHILSAVTMLAQILGLTVIAEGVETADHLDMLRQAGCEVGQGHLFSAPLDAEPADALVTAQAAMPLLLSG